MRPDIILGTLLAVFLTWRIIEKLRGDRTEYPDDGTMRSSRDDDDDDLDDDT